MSFFSCPVDVAFVAIVILAANSYFAIAVDVVIAVVVIVAD